MGVHLVGAGAILTCNPRHGITRLVFNVFVDTDPFRLTCMFWTAFSIWHTDNWYISNWTLHAVGRTIVDVTLANIGGTARVFWICLVGKDEPWTAAVGYRWYWAHFGLANHSLGGLVTDAALTFVLKPFIKLARNSLRIKTSTLGNTDVRLFVKEFHSIRTKAALSCVGNAWITGNVFTGWLFCRTTWLVNFV